MSSMQKPKRPYDLFYLYADKDKALLDKLDTHLKILEFRGDIKSFSRQDISPGIDWQQALDQRMDKSSIILLLISSDFIASSYIHGPEIERAIQRYKNKEAIIIPIIIRKCHWEKVWLGQHEALIYFEILPENKKPVKNWPDQDVVFTEITEAVERTVQELRLRAEEKRRGIVSNRHWSIYPKQVDLLHISPLEDLQPNPLHITGQNMTRSSGSRSTNRTSTGMKRVPTQLRDPGGHTRSNTQQNAQFAGERVVELSWGKKPFLKLQSFSRTIQEVFKSDNINAYFRGFRVFFLMFFLTLDVGGLSLVSQDWQISQEQPPLVLALSVLLILLGMLNIYDSVALVLALLFGIAWIAIAFHYMPLHSIAIPIVIAMSFPLAVFRFILFRASKRRGSPSRSR